MALGLVLIAMLSAASVSVVLFLYGFPLWVVLLAYPVTGTVVLLPGVALVSWVRQAPKDASSQQLATSQSPAAPHPQSSAGSSNP
jgi:membrane protein implicated in regulation of membrane protease activity